MNYDFSALSDYDLELLARDLLQKELGLTLESFAKGRDGGIDLRHSRTKGKRIVVQCKHYVGSGFNKLKFDLKKEAGKLKDINPDEYMVVTSVPMTPDRKEELLKIFEPWCKSPQHIFGQEDLNNLLHKFPEVEKSHFKLWLTSAHVLERVLHASIFSESQSEVETIRRQVSRYVHNNSFSRAINVLEEVRYCIITGIPGIGKTTLAQMLLAYYVDQGYEVIRVWEGISEARSVLDPTRKQVFYFDDFLGRTGLEQKLEKNEDERLLRFIADVSRSKATRFIMTTREYILNQAKLIYEALRENRFDGAKCLIDLQDYTPYIRAKILYNHVYFSDLPREHVSKFADEATYSKIIGHRNFSPRIIDRMTDFLNVRGLPAQQYVQEFITNLDNPSRVWEFAFHNHLSDAGRNVLLTLTTLPDIVKIEDLKKAFDEFQSFRARQYQFRRTPYDFDRAIKELEGNFLVVKKVWGAKLLVEFHNPSVRDFLEGHLKNSMDDVDDLIRCSVFPDQVRFLSTKFAQHSGNDHVLSLTQAYVRTFEQQTARLQRISIGRNGTIDWQRYSISREQLYRWSVDLWDTTRPSGASSVFDTITQRLLDHLDASQSSFDYETLVLILEDQQRERLPQTSLTQRLQEAIFRVVLYFDEDWWGLGINQVRGIVSLVERFPQHINEPTHEKIRQGFLQFAEEEMNSIREEDEGDYMLSRLEELEHLASRLGIEELPGTDEVRDLAERLPGPPDPEDDERDYDEWRDSVRTREQETAEIRSMFETLADKKGDS